MTVNVQRGAIRGMAYGRKRLLTVLVQDVSVILERHWRDYIVSEARSILVQKSCLDRAPWKPTEVCKRGFRLQVL